MDLRAAIDAVLAVSPSRHSVVHGETHWCRVAWTGVRIGQHSPGCDLALVALFGLLHDSMRWHDEADPAHGERAGDLARRLNDSVLGLSADRIDLLDAACYAHAFGDTSYDATVGTCWDADRLDLWRVGLELDSSLLSTPVAQSMHAREWLAQARRAPPSWATVTEIVDRHDERRPCL